MNWYASSINDNTGKFFLDRKLNSSNAFLTKNFMMKAYVLLGDAVSSFTLPQVVDWPELYAKYPILKDVEVKIGIHALDPSANMLVSHMVSKNKYSIIVNREKAFKKSPERIIRSFIHEIVHLIEFVEGKPAEEVGTLTTDSNRSTNPGELLAKENAESHKGWNWSEDFNGVDDA